jgi:hypothetical protein
VNYWLPFDLSSRMLMPDAGPKHQIAIGGQFRVADDRLPAKLFRLSAHKLGVAARLIAPAVRGSDPGW